MPGGLVPIAMTDVTRILTAIERGEANATDDLLPLVYEELRLLAAQKLSRESPGQTLQATALVHEAYLRLLGGDGQNWQGRRHFFAAAAEAMRRILVENARRKKSLKRGGGHIRISLEGIDAAPDARPEELLALDEALTQLAAEDSVKAELVTLRFLPASPSTRPPRCSAFLARRRSVTGRLPARGSSRRCAKRAERTGPR